MIMIYALSENFPDSDIDHIQRAADKCETGCHVLPMIEGEQSASECVVQPRDRLEFHRR